METTGQFVVEGPFSVSTWCSRFRAYGREMEKKTEAQENLAPHYQAYTRESQYNGNGDPNPEWREIFVMQLRA